MGAEATISDRATNVKWLWKLYTVIELDYDTYGGLTFWKHR